MPGKLSQALDKATVASLASAPSYERGLVYLDAGRVGPLRVSAERVAATVQGSEDYLVELRAKGEKLRSSCSCPVGRQGAFCKHCVAVALAWLHEHDDPAPTLDDARVHLETLPQSELVDVLIDHAHDDEALARKLLLRAATPTSAKADVASLRALIEQAFAFRGFVPYREVWGYVRGIEEAIDVLEAQLEQGGGGDVVDLAEHALKAAERALDHIDGSDGQMGDAIARIEELHLDACSRARPDPTALAERLFAWELDGPWDVFDQAVIRYAEVLGDAGLARYSELAEKAWAAAWFTARSQRDSAECSPPGVARGELPGLGRDLRGDRRGGGVPGGRCRRGRLAGPRLHRGDRLGWQRLKLRSLNLLTVRTLRGCPPMDETEHFVLFRPSRHSAPGVHETPTIPANRRVSASTATLTAARESPANPRRIAVLGPEKMDEVCQALRGATSC